MLDISGKDVKIWVNEHDGRNGKWKSYAISVSKKVDGKYVSKPVKVRLTKELEERYNLKSGSLIDFAGFPSLDIYTDKDGNERRDVMIFIQKMKLHGEEYDSFEELDEDIPF